MNTRKPPTTAASRRRDRRSSPWRRVGRAAAVAVGLWGAVLSSPAAGAPPPTDPPSSDDLAEQTTEDATLTWSVKPGPSDDGSQRPNYSYDLEPGEQVTDSIVVRNFTAEPLPLVVYASDARTTSTGALDLLPAGEPTVDVGSWVVLDTFNIEVPANGELTVPFTLTVPSDAEPGDHSGGIVTSLRSSATDADGQAVVLDRRLGSRMHVRVAGDLEPALEITDVAVSYSGTPNPIGTGTLHVAYTVTNTGNVRLGATQAVAVPGRFGFPGREIQLEDMGELLPDNSLTYEVDIPDVWASFRTGAGVELTPVPTREGDSFDGVDVVSASSTTWAVPWTGVAVLVIVVAVPLWIRWSRRRRARTEAARVEQAVQTAVIVQEAIRAAIGDSSEGGGDVVRNGHAPLPPPGALDAVDLSPAPGAPQADVEGRHDEADKPA